jgi:hypothetical protein
MTVSLLWKQLDMNEEDILRITDELLLRRSFILEIVLSFIYLGTILLILFTHCIVRFSFCNFFITVGINSTISSINCSCSESWNSFLFCFNWLLSFLFDGALVKNLGWRIIMFHDCISIVETTWYEWRGHSKNYWWISLNISASSGAKIIKICLEMTSQYFFLKNVVLYKIYCVISRMTNTCPSTVYLIDENLGF